MHELKTIINIFIINIKIIAHKFINNKKKVILFFFSRKNLTLINENYLHFLFKKFDKNYLIIYGHQINYLEKKNYYYLKESFLLKFLFNIDIFFSNYVSDKFSNSSINIYMHHDISTAPLVDIKSEKKLFNRIIKYHYIFSPQMSSSKMFNNFLLKYAKNNSITIPKIFETGYPKLDYLRKKKINFNTLKNIIVIAPTDFRHIKKLSLYNDLEKILELIFKKTNYKVYFRPYPANLNSLKVSRLIKKFLNNDKFILDNSNDYINIYSKSKFLLTDISGTAITYSYYTNRKVIFYSRNEKLIKNTFYKDSSFFADRKKFGVITTKPSQIVNFLNNKRIVNYVDLTKDIKYLDNSKNRIKYLIKTKILNQ